MISAPDLPCRLYTVVVKKIRLIQKITVTLSRHTITITKQSYDIHRTLQIILGSVIHRFIKLHKMNWTLTKHLIYHTVTSQ